MVFVGRRLTSGFINRVNNQQRSLIFRWRYGPAREEFNSSNFFPRRAEGVGRFRICRFEFPVEGHRKLALSVGSLEHNSGSRNFYDCPMKLELFFDITVAG